MKRARSVAVCACFVCALNSIGMTQEDEASASGQGWSVFARVREEKRRVLHELETGFWLTTVQTGLRKGPLGEAVQREIVIDEQPFEGEEFVGRIVARRKTRTPPLVPDPCDRLLASVIPSPVVDRPECVSIEHPGWVPNPEALVILWTKSPQGKVVGVDFQGPWNVVQNIDSVPLIGLDAPRECTFRVDSWRCTGAGRLHMYVALLLKGVGVFDDVAVHVRLQPVRMGRSWSLVAPPDSDQKVVYRFWTCLDSNGGGNVLFYTVESAGESPASSDNWARANPSPRGYRIASGVMPQSVHLAWTQAKEVRVVWDLESGPCTSHAGRIRRNPTSGLYELQREP